MIDPSGIVQLCPQSPAAFVEVSEGEKFEIFEEIMPHQETSMGSDLYYLCSEQSEHTHCNGYQLEFMTDQDYIMHLDSPNKHINLSVPPEIEEIQLKPYAPKSPRMPKKYYHLPNTEKKRGRPSHRSTEVLNNGTVTANNCEECGLRLANDVQVRKHYKSVHPGVEFLKRYMCDVCGHITQHYHNLIAHMRIHSKEKPFECSYCGRLFNKLGNRDRHFLVHTGEKRYKCEICQRRFTQSNGLKLHVQTVHLKIPYPPWDKRNRKPRKENVASASSTSLYSSTCLMKPDPEWDYLGADI